MTRKGAIAVYLEPWHIDILDFIDLKKNSGEDRRRAHDLFPALWIGDDFMKAIEENLDWNLYCPSEPEVVKHTMKAKDLWKKILTSYAESGSPFLCFKDTANRANPNSHVGHIRSSNLCTEIFQNTDPNHYMIKLYYSVFGINSDEEDYILVEENEDVLLSDGTTKKGNKITSLDTIAGKPFCFDYDLKVYCVEKHKVDGKTAVCNLASVNLSKINTKEDFERVVPIAIRMLDNVIDLNYYPLKKVKDTNLKSRSIGLGVMGEAQMLAENKVMFGSREHFKWIDKIMEQFSYNAIKSSMELAKEKGSYPDFSGSKWSKGIFPQDHANEDVLELTYSHLDDDMHEKWTELRKNVIENGIRNGYLMAIAPTSSISILVGTTQAIEPVYKKKWFEENLSGLIPVVVPNLSTETYQYYVSAYDVDQLDIIRAAAIRQKWIDQGQSTNIFINPEVTSGKRLNDIYMMAWRLGNKSTYYLRSRSPENKIDVEDRSMECSGCQ